MTTQAPRPQAISFGGFRETNQDRVFTAVVPVKEGPVVVLCVADGMGGLSHGGQAAETAVAAVSRYAREVLPATTSGPAALRAGLVDAFQEANRQVYHLGQKLRETVGTTLIIAVVQNGRFMVAHAGDSRCYQVSAGACRQLTVDHSHVQELVATGAMTAEQALQSPYRNQLTNSLGEPAEIRVDFFPQAEAWAEMEEDSVLLLTSDGLHGEVSAASIGSILRGTRNLQDGFDQLISLALAEGSTDNVSMAAVEHGQIRRNKLARRLPAPAKMMQAMRQAPAPRSQGALRIHGANYRALLGGFVLGVIVTLGVQFLWTELSPAKSSSGAFASRQDRTTASDAKHSDVVGNSAPQPCPPLPSKAQSDQRPQRGRPAQSTGRPGTEGQSLNSGRR